MELAAIECAAATAATRLRSSGAIGLLRRSDRVMCIEMNSFVGYEIVRRCVIHQVDGVDALFIVVEELRRDANRVVEDEFCVHK